ncbi:PadR family transcriptional regulator [Sandaracinus amylolyticus]|uniref:Transcriptional regulator, PadR family protein n=1 Tax=Sandaracinus amylolyticus TaxID=927083 RepID=A0A0F6SDJ7_9BACT|nr:PadR family transcriptional regulator [Sandaracinus amylolyticus]AKF03564.1 Transcriptional regulator, PadR family protein [Sandaracinus amylolyticus]UJR83962.1 Hypothetical protein I5071_60330 [Sandaracinus amylolyticus]
MALQDAILAALADGSESSGYDLAKAFDYAVANFWTATPAQLYRELEKMQDEGLVAARVVAQEKRPNKRLLSLTKAGRKALHEFTTRDPKPTAIRDELLIQVDAMEHGDLASVKAHIEARLAIAEQKLAYYKKSRERSLDGCSEEDFLVEEERVGPYLTLLRGISFEQENIRWAKLALKVLAKREAARR